MPAMTKKRKYEAIKRATAGPCVMCAALLPLANPPRQQNTEIESTKGMIRYCICKNCGHRWKQAVERPSIS